MTPPEFKIPMIYANGFDWATITWKYQDDEFKFKVKQPKKRQGYINLDGWISIIKEMKKIKDDLVDGQMHKENFAEVVRQKTKETFVELSNEVSTTIDECMTLGSYYLEDDWCYPVIDGKLYGIRVNIDEYCEYYFKKYNIKFPRNAKPMYELEESE